NNLELPRHNQVLGRLCPLVPLQCCIVLHFVILYYKWHLFCPTLCITLTKCLARMYVLSSAMAPKEEPVPDTHHGTGHVTLIRHFAWDLACACGIALAYFLSASIALNLIVQPEGIAAIWPPSGLLLAVAGRHGVA